LPSSPSVALPDPNDDEEVQRLTSERDALNRQFRDLEKEQERRQEQLAALSDPTRGMTARAKMVRLANQADELHPELERVTGKRQRGEYDGELRPKVVRSCTVDRR